MSFLKNIKALVLKNKSVLLFAAALGLFELVVPSLGFASMDVRQGISMASIENNVTFSMKHISSIIHAMSILAGVSFFVAFAFKAKQHKDNPTQVPIGQPLMYLFLAITLSMLPYFISSSKRIVYGSQASLSQWDHSQMQQLFGITGGTGTGGDAIPE